jgi:SET domain-containing protein
MKDHYSPLPDELIFAVSAIHGIGVFASMTISAGTRLGITHVRDIRFQDGLIRTELGGMTNHSCEPNCIITEEEDLLYLDTIDDISTGEEITVNYRVSVCGKNYFDESE